MKNSKIYLFTYFLCSYLFIYYLFHSQSIILTLKIWALTTTITGTTVMVTLIIKVTIVMIIMITDNSNGSNTTTKNDNKNENIGNNDYQNIMRKQQFYIGSTICSKMSWNIKILVFSRSSIYPLSRHGALSAHIKDVRDHVSRWNCIIKKIK